MMLFRPLIWDFESLILVVGNAWLQMSVVWANVLALLLSFIRLAIFTIDAVCVWFKMKVLWLFVAVIVVVIGCVVIDMLWVLVFIDIILVFVLVAVFRHPGMTSEMESEVVFVVIVVVALVMVVLISKRDVGWVDVLPLGLVVGGEVMTSRLMLFLWGERVWHLRFKVFCNADWVVGFKVFLDSNYMVWVIRLEFFLSRK